MLTPRTRYGGSYHIPDDVVTRRYHRGLYNLVHFYIPHCDKWMVVDNMDLVPEIIAQNDGFGKVIFNDEIWTVIQQPRIKEVPAREPLKTLPEKRHTFCHTFLKWLKIKKYNIFI